MNYLYTYQVDGQKQVEEAITHWTRGGLVTFCWHWRVDNALEFYTDKVSTQIPIKNNQLDTASSVFATLKANMDTVAAGLAKLQDAGVPVLWRPLHEASGGWFWWGRSRSDGVSASNAYIQLYRYMYDYFTKTKGLHNLLWVWNGQSASWYPGDQYVDIVGTDIYDGQKNYGSQISAYSALKGWPSQVKPVAMTETSNLPDPDNIARDGAWWLWFVVWNDGKAGEGVTDSSNFWTGEYYNTNAEKKKVMNHANVISLDELPKFSGGTTTSTPTTTGTPTHTTTTTATPTTPVTGTTVAKWGQCGGNGYSGPTKCVAGTTCVKQNDWYSQCV